MKKMKKEEVIDDLVQDSAINISEDFQSIREMFRYGHDGFENYTNKQLEEEWDAAYDEKIKVID